MLFEPGPIEYIDIAALEAYLRADVTPIDIGPPSEIPAQLTAHAAELDVAHYNFTVNAETDLEDDYGEPLEAVLDDVNAFFAGDAPSLGDDISQAMSEVDGDTQTFTDRADDSGDWTFI